MRRFGLILICVLAMTAGTAIAGTYKLTDGTQVTGDPLSLTEEGIEFKQSDGSVTPRYTWDKLSAEAIRALFAESKSPHDRALLQPLADNFPAETVTKPMDLVVKPFPTPPLRTKQTGILAIFGSSVGWIIVLVLYAANLLAAFEVANYKRQAVSTVCGLAAVPVLGVLSPIIFIALPSKAPAPSTVEAAQPAAAGGAEGNPVPEAIALGGGARSAAAESSPTSSPRRAPISMPGVESGAAEEPAAEVPTLPEPIVFARGEFTFNRRFFETKFPGFFRAVRAEAEKDLVLLLKTNRGEFVGRRITRITPNELYLQVFNNEVTADEMIPFIEVMEVQIRHKDAT